MNKTFNLEDELRDYQNILKKKIFDWERYISHYSDLKIAGIDNEQKALDHYNNYGEKENRIYFLKDHIKQNNQLKNIEQNTELSVINNQKTKIVVARYNEDLSIYLPLKDYCVIYNKGNDDIQKDFSNVIKLQNVGREGGTYITHIINNYDNLDDYTIFIQGCPIDHCSLNSRDFAFENIKSRLFEEKNYKFKYLSIHSENFERTHIVMNGTGIPCTPVEFGEPLNIDKLIIEIRNWININIPNEVCINPSYIPLNNPGNGIIRDLEEMKKNNKFSIHPFELWELFQKDFWYLTSGNGEKMRQELTLKCFDLSLIDKKLENGYSFNWGACFIVHKSQILKYPKWWWERLGSKFDILLPGAGWGMERLWRFVLE